MIFACGLEAQLQSELNRTRPVRIYRMQKGRAGDAIGSAVCPEPRRINRTGVTSDHVVTASAGIVRIVNTELGMVKDVESFHTELNLARFRDLDVLGQGHVKVQTTRIIEKIPARISESQPARRHKLRGIAQQWPKALRIGQLCVDVLGLGNAGGFG